MMLLLCLHYQSNQIKMNVLIVFNSNILKFKLVVYLKLFFFFCNSLKKIEELRRELHELKDDLGQANVLLEVKKKKLIFKF